MFRVDRKIPTHGSTVPVGNKASWDGGLSGWDFLVSIEHEWWIVFVWYAKTNFLSSYQLSSNSSPYVMALRVYIFENRRKNAPFAQISLRIRVVTRASVSHLKKWSWKYGLFIASQSCTLAPAELIICVALWFVLRCVSCCVLPAFFSCFSVLFSIVITRSGKIYLGSEQQWRWSDCAEAQADLRLCCSHMT